MLTKYILNFIKCILLQINKPNHENLVYSNLCELLNLSELFISINLYDCFIHKFWWACDAENCKLIIDTYAYYIVKIVKIFASWNIHLRLFVDGSNRIYREAYSYFKLVWWTCKFFITNHKMFFVRLLPQILLLLP